MFVHKVFKVHEIILSVLVLIGLFSCNSEDEDLTLGANFVDNSTKFIQVDTFSIEFSTIIVDSLTTSATGILLAGYHEDGDFGKINSNSFFQIGLPTQTNIDIEVDDRFDSLTLVLPYSSYYYGDTNVIQEINIYRLKEKLVNTDVTNYYNTSKIELFDDPIGKFNYFPKPNRDSTIEIRIDDLLGEDLFNKMKYNEEEVSSSEEFEEYIYGFAIIPNQIQSSAIIGFAGSDIKFNLYSSRIDEEIEEIIYQFPSTDLTYQFNQINIDRIGTVLESLTSQSDELKSTLLNNKSYVQAGTGVLTKIRFPNLNCMLFDEDQLILSIELIIKPDIVSYDGNFPESLSLYETNKYNDLEITSEDKFVTVSSFNLDEMYHLDTYYTFDITNFLQEQIDDGYIDNDRCLLLTVEYSEFNTTMDRFIANTSNDPENKPRLKITYLEI